MIPKLPVFILAGGKSSRFGNPGDDKARAQLHGKPLILRLAEQVIPIAETLTVIADHAGKYQDLNLTTLADEYPGLGPLAGLQRALSYCNQIIINNKNTDSTTINNDWLLLISCDMVIIKPQWVYSLYRETTKTSCRPSNPSPRIIAFADFDNQHNQPTRIHPMPALYHQSIAPIVNRHIQSRNLSMRSLIRALPTKFLPLPENWPDIPQINTTEEYRQIADNQPGNSEI